mgnify:CR=1 FL=1
MDEFVIKSQVDSYHEKIEHLNAEVESNLLLQIKAYQSSVLTETVKDQNSKNERPTIAQHAKI